MGFQQIFGGTSVQPSQVGYQAITLAANTTLAWPIETMGGVPYASGELDVTASVGALALLMPNATQGATGVICLIANVGSNSFTVQDNAGNPIVTIAASQQWLIVLTANTTQAGSWRAYQLAATTSNAQASSLAGQGLQALGSLLQTTILSRTTGVNGNILNADRAYEIIWNGATGTLTYDTLANLTTGWWGIVTNQGSGVLTLATSGGATINGQSSITLPVGIAASGQFYSAIVVCTAGGLIAFTTPTPVPIGAGGTGATTAGAALTNLGGTATGTSIFTAPSVAAILAILGISATLITESSVSGNQVLTSSSGGTAYVATAAINLTVPLTTTLTKSFFFALYAQGGNVTVIPNPSDQINGLAAGTNFVVQRGASAFFFTDANGNWWPLLIPGAPASFFAAAGGTVDAITATYTPQNTSLTDGLLLGFRATGQNLTTTTTFAPDGLTAHTITRRGGLVLAPGDIPGNLAECLVRYNLANTRWELLNPATVQIPWVAAAGTADAITATYSPAIGALFDGLELGFRATAANATTTPTFAPNGLTAHTITKAGGVALAAGDIPGNLAECVVRYNLASTRWELLNPATTGGSGSSTGIMGGPFRNLVAKYAGGAKTGTVTADAIAVATASDASVFIIEALSVTLDISSNGAVNKLDTGTVGASTLYYLWAISNRTTSGVLASLSSTAPTMPAGYTYKTRIGAFFTDGGSNIVGGNQLGNKFRYITPTSLAVGPAGTFSVTAPVWAAQSLVTVVPPTAAKYTVQASNTTAGHTETHVLVAPNNTYVGTDAVPPPPLYLDNLSTIRQAGQADFVYESANVYWVGGGTGSILLVSGWEDNL